MGSRYQQVHVYKVHLQEQKYPVRYSR